MNLVEQLLKADVSRADEREEKVIKSKKLAKILGLEEAVDIKIKEIPPKRMNDIVAHQFTKSGKFDITKSFDTQLLTCVEGIIDPPIKEEELRKHFKCATPKELVEKLFGGEATKISQEITTLSGYEDDEVKELEEEIKN